MGSWAKYSFGKQKSDRAIPDLEQEASQERNNRGHPTRHIRALQVGFCTRQHSIIVLWMQEHDRVPMSSNLGDRVQDSDVLADMVQAFLPPQHVASGFPTPVDVS